jgi:hypothetical protein
MLKSAATVVGIVLGSLAVSGLAASPSEAQKIRTSIPCAPLVADYKRCHNHRFEICKHTATRGPNGECVRQTKCTQIGISCSPRPRPRPGSATAPSSLRGSSAA